MNDVPPPAAPATPSVWEGYQPPASGGGSSPRARRARRLGLVGVVVAVVAVVAELVAVFSSPSPAVVSSSACSPSPCANDGSGLSVSIASVARLPRSAAHQPVDPAPTVVQVTVRFANTSPAVRTVDPLDFRLRDGSGAEHALVLDVGSSCGIFESVNQPPMSTLGPKVMCFAVNGPPSQRLTLVWTPGARRIEIPLGP